MACIYSAENAVMLSQESTVIRFEHTAGIYISIIQSDAALVKITHHNRARGRCGGGTVTAGKGRTGRAATLHRNEGATGTGGTSDTYRPIQATGKDLWAGPRADLCQL